MTHKVVLGYLAKKFNKELENRQALFGNGRIEDLIGKQIHQAMPVYEEEYPGTGDGIALTFTDGTYVFLPSDFPEEVCTTVHIEGPTYLTDLKLLRSMCVINDADYDNLLQDISDATESANIDKIVDKVKALSTKLTKKEKELLLKQLQSESL